MKLSSFLLLFVFEFGFEFGLSFGFVLVLFGLAGRGGALIIMGPTYALVMKSPAGFSLNLLFN
jgi:hypothetical protein